MNSIRQIQELNRRELENGVPPSASWHTDYRDTAYIYIGGLPFELSEGDVLTIFSQYGEPTYINLVRDKETGKSKGFAFLKYEDQRSTDLAVDNLGGAVIAGRTLKVDHTRYKRKEGEEDTGMDLNGGLDDEGDERRKRRRTSAESEGSEDEEEQRPMLKEERELALLIRDHDEDDPMKAFLIEEKKEEVAKALGRAKERSKPDKSEKSRKHRHHHRSRYIKDEEDLDGSHRSRHRSHGHDRERDRDRESRKRYPEDNRDRRSRREWSPR
ncbi:hypothetical protein SS1G_03313 [Sclerotinia sclerotiorum 1980 UF-70]|uniref:RRM domain-containing protein n=1 Tax=Sclerotinia sclerotiorum (strain ATCC 18683 / 1980 / Ss-1) TaxID=665079 RepID=A7EDC3_SCLS1|nr:hypothetical protein SS1G_03313 [Sclerotinia sclerotiorum 1980 UF-70]EDO00839.1 hypothetical protein SS1G_03313 [Sclerotinia sclerotiorum 1980 UF-70]